MYNKRRPSGRIKRQRLAPMDSSDNINHSHSGPMSQTLDNEGKPPSDGFVVTSQHTTTIHASDAAVPTEGTASMSGSTKSHPVARDGTSSSEEGVESSGSTSRSDAAIVTNSNTNSSSEDRDFNTSRIREENFESSNNNSSSSDDVPASQATIDKHDQSIINHGHHQASRQRKQSARAGETSDGLGLPVPNDNNVNASEHAKVVAHLPPPYLDSSGSGGESEGKKNGKESISLVEPHREPGYHTIKRTLNQFVKSNKAESSCTSHHRKIKHGKKRSSEAIEEKSASTSRKRAFREVQERTEKNVDKDVSNDETGGSSGSGTEGGYAGSASSNEPAQAESSPSVSSSESIPTQRKHSKGPPAVSGDPNRVMLSQKPASNSSVSSEIADFSSGLSESAAEMSSNGFRESSPSPSDSPSITSSSNADGSSDDQEEAILPVKSHRKVVVKGARRSSKWPPLPRQVASRTEPRIEATAKAQRRDKTKTGMLSLGCDLMAHVLTFLEPPEILRVLVSPLSKDWLTNFTRQPELWRVLCLLEPFKANVPADNDSGYESVDSYPSDVDNELRKTFGKYRLMYTSFVKCMRYLARIREDAAIGRAPPVQRVASASQKSSRAKSNDAMRSFLSKARKIQKESRSNTNSKDEQQDSKPKALASRSNEAMVRKLKKRKRRSSKNGPSPKVEDGKPKFGHSMITERILGPSMSGDPGDVTLPWSCAIYSIVNWMTAFSDVEGIQTMCLKVLPPILENEMQRSTAQRAGLTNTVLRAMILFPDSSPLHTAAFHAIVLLARPLGGREGMLFHSSMVNAAGIFDSGDTGSRNGKSGIAVMLDSMKRFETDGVLQAMSCWSLVNIALAPTQKQVLVRLGGIQATANAMMVHPHDAEVQFRGLFALINLVIPSVRNENGDIDTVTEDTTEKKMLDEVVDQIVRLVVLAMRNFCSSEAILNRACLVLHNISLSQSYHGALLWTPNCYQMLEWCMANYRSDQVLQQSAAGTLHRLQVTLSGDEALRTRFAASIQAQQQLSLEEAHREAVYLRDRQEQLSNANGGGQS